jgi:hypothetical protein
MIVVSRARLGNIRLKIEALLSRLFSAVFSLLYLLKEFRAANLFCKADFFTTGTACSKFSALAEPAVSGNPAAGKKKNKGGWLEEPN